MALKTSQMQTDLTKFRNNWDEALQSDAMKCISDSGKQGANAGKKLKEQLLSNLRDEYIQGVEMYENEKVNYFGNSPDWYYVHGICLNTGHHAGVTVQAKNKFLASVNGIHSLNQENTERDYRANKVSLLTPLQRKKRGL